MKIIAIGLVCLIAPLSALATSDQLPEGKAVVEEIPVSPPKIGLTITVPKGWTYDVSDTPAGMALLLKPSIRNKVKVRQCRIDRHILKPGYFSSGQPQINDWLDRNPMTREIFSSRVNAGAEVRTTIIDVGRAELDSATAYWAETQAKEAAWMGMLTMRLRTKTYVTVTPGNEWVIQCLVGSYIGAHAVDALYSDALPTFDAVISSIRFSREN
ncbi:hypothetical protein HDG34_005651 [Paraburkholderia sp. HC6.4b]|uniref:hypothetical protein n=1 Tax=unclassified Paraburkholderia TaxID=2615204 RepID=UPI00160A4DBE|nr:MULTISPECIES: hypothetical protein [unclassified Paraburkholderia]MBB5411690.1 hypothetical protein [Paraburkholderia sp. HC6.4b]MBB5453281.1 hypothetical protein [Paraburkholderia sp. Kb1A]